jgi:hypothetical protein
MLSQVEREGSEKKRAFLRFWPPACASLSVFAIIRLRIKLRQGFELAVAANFLFLIGRSGRPSS